MKKENYSSFLLEKLAGELTENEVKELENFVNSDNALKDDYEFFTAAWEEMGHLKTNRPSDNLAQNFYTQLSAIERKENNSLTNRIQAFFANFSYSSILIKNLSFGILLIAVGFFLSDILTNNKLSLQSSTEETNTTTNGVFALSTHKIQEINSLSQTDNEEKIIKDLKHILQTEGNTNVRLAALTQLNHFAANNPQLRNFYLQQLEREHSPLIQVELLNAIIETSKTRESITTMESMLAKKKVNPVLQEKIQKDLPVLRASFVQ